MPNDLEFAFVFAVALALGALGGWCAGVEYAMNRWRRAWRNALEEHTHDL